METVVKYSEKQWKIISTLPQLVGLLMSTAEYSGVEGSIQELKAAVYAILDAKLKYPENDIITQIIPKANSLEIIFEEIKKQQSDLIHELNVNSDDDLLKFQNETIVKMKEVISYLRENESDFDIKEYKEWLINIAERVAVASIEGTVFGQKADPFCEKEREMFAIINDALIDN